MNILSLFDGMACGMLAFQKAGATVDTYTAYEIDKYAIQTATHNFPNIKECGDVFEADFTQYKNIDYIVGGSPCVPTGSKIKTDKGYKPIEEIIVGDMVLTHKNRYRPVSRLYKRQSDHLYRIKFNNDVEIQITGNHPIYTYRNDKFEFIRTDELKVGDYGCINIDPQHKSCLICDDNIVVVEDKLLIKIKEIEKQNADVTVYNIEAEEDHSYTVNNVIVKNCTYWSIAQKNNRETEASGMGWELFSQYVRAVKEVKPKFFIYENNKSMSNAIRQSISETFGFEPICINSALVSAQNRQRLYWVGKRNDDGTYSKVDVQQPEDRGILLKDILDGGLSLREKSLCLDANYFKGGNLTNLKKQSGQRLMVAEPVNVTSEGKAQCLRATYYKDGIRNMVGNNVDRKTCVAEPVSEPIRVGALPRPNGELSTSQSKRIYSAEGKSVNLCSGSGGLGAQTGLYVIPVEFSDNKPTKAISCADGKTYTVYEVKDGQITIKGKQYPIKLIDGYYIIRKLTVSECKRLQTVPEWYEFPVSNSQAYKMLGAGWTIDVIAHLIEATLKAD